MTLINAKNNNKAASLPPNEEMLVNLIFPVLSHFTVYFSLCVYYTITTLPLRNIPSANRLSSYWWPVAQVFLCPAHVNFQCLYQWVPIQWSSKYHEKSETCYSESFTIFPSNLELLSLNDGLLVFPSMHSCF